MKVITMTIFLSIFSFINIIYAGGYPPSLDCENFDIKVMLTENPGGLQMLTILSKNKWTPLLPGLDKRIRKIEIAPMPCSGVGSNATICYADVCRFERYYDENGNLLEQLSEGSNVILTTIPRWVDDYKKQVLSFHFEFDGLYGPDLVKNEINTTFELYPSIECR